MSNETMTPDLIPAWRAATAACLEGGAYVAPLTPEQWAKALRAAFSAQASKAELQPFGHYFSDDPKVFAMPGTGFKRGTTPPPDSVDAVPLYTCPQALLIAGDTTRELPANWQLLAEHSGCGYGAQVDRINVRMERGDKVVLIPAAPAAPHCSRGPENCAFCSVQAGTFSVKSADDPESR